MPGGNWVTVGFNLHLVHIFWGFERKVRCAQNIVFCTFFCLQVSPDLANNVEILKFLGVDQSTILQFSCFAMLETALFTRFSVALRPGV